MSDVQSEKELVATIFGTVSDRRVVYFGKKGWFRGGSRQDIPLKHVTSVRVDTWRSLFLGLPIAFTGFLCSLAILSGSGGATVFGVVVGLPLLFLGVILVWSSPSVMVNTAGTDLSASVGWPWQRGEAEKFAETLRSQLFRE